MKRAIAALTLGLMTILIPTTAGATTDKVYVCHATGSATNPYVLVHVSVNSAHLDETKENFHVKDVAPEVFEVAGETFRLCPGVTGPQGPAGPQGEQGEPGEKGDQGERGLTGEPGGRGVDGLNGKDGVDGTNGLNGLDAPNLQSEIDNLRAVVTELNNRLFILENTAPATPEAPAQDSSGAETPVSHGELPKTGSNAPYLVALGGILLLAGIATRMAFARR